MSLREIRLLAVLFVLWVCILAVLVAHFSRIGAPEHPISVRRGPADGITLVFEDVSAASGVLRHVASYGPAWGDVNGDGLPDVYVGAHERAPLLFVNNGDGTFSEVSSAWGIPEEGDTHGAAWGDYDNDGDLDLYQSMGAFGGRGKPPGKLDRLFRNEGTRFVEVGESAGVTDRDGRARAPVWIDYDSDGLLDLYVANAGSPHRLFRNAGNGHFSDVSNETGAASVGEIGWPHNAYFADYDGDDILDLFVPWSERLVAVADGAGRFKGVTQKTGLVSSEYMAWGDYDNDLDEDVFLVSLLPPHSGDALMVNVDGEFWVPIHRERIKTDGATQAAWGDYDNDGDLDLYVVTGNKSMFGGNRLMRNDRGRFVDVAREAGVDAAHLRYGRSANWVDYDGDGFLDLFLVDGRNYRVPADNSSQGSLMADPILLFRNGGAANSWLMVRLVGTQSNRDGVGAKLLASTGDGVQVRWAGPQVATHSQSVLPVHFGLGAWGALEHLIIFWPSGIIQTLTDVQANQTLVVVEPAT